MSRAKILVPVLVAALLGGHTAAAQDAPDVQRYDVRVTLQGATLAVETTVVAAGRAPAQWSLDLVPEMNVSAAESGGKPVGFNVAGRALVLDTQDVAPGADGTFAVTVRAQGAPGERFSKERGGFVRSAVGEDRVYVRSQVPWYPRAADDPAVHRVVVDAPAGWQVRSAGASDRPVAQGGRALWTFDTKTPVGVAGLAAGPWRVVTAGAFDALVEAGHEDSAAGLLALAKKSVEFHAADLGPITRPRYALVEMPASFGTGSGYSECGYILLGPGAFESGAGAAWVRGFVAHEAAHQWWGQDALFSDFAVEMLAEFGKHRFVEATDGADAARRMRKDAVVAVAQAAAAGKAVALGEIRGYGGAMDADTYAVHAYQKGAMLLSMVGRAVGAGPMKKVLAEFLRQGRTRRVAWTDLRAVLVAAGPAAKEIVEQWEAPGLPSLQLTSQTTKSGGAWKVAGKVSQSGTSRPYRMTVSVVATAGDKRVATDVKLAAADAEFTLRAPFEPQAVVLDPDWQVLAAREVAEGTGKRALESGMKVANTPGERDKATLERAVADLRGALDSKELIDGESAAARTGIGKCLFVLERFDEAEKELRAALEAGAGGPFHRGWVNLRLGCIADLRGRRDEALAFYRAAVEGKGASQTAVEKAKAFLERPYRGLAKDG